jgi:hypothetical protein
VYAGFGPGEAGRVSSGSVKVGLAVPAPVSVTAGPETCRQARVFAPRDAEPSRVTVRPRRTVWSGPAAACVAVAAPTTVVAVAGLETPPGPVATSWNE